jgi:ATP-dependent Lon protease
MPETVTLPVLPLRELVVFPGVTSPIAAGRPASLRAIDAAIHREDKNIFVLCQRQNIDEASPEDLYTVGTIARIEQVHRGLSGIQLILHGVQRGIAVRVREQDGMLQAIVRKAEEMMPPVAEDPSFLGLHRELRARAAEMGRKSGLPREAVQQVLASLDQPGQLADLVAGYLDIGAHDAQELLETLSVEERMRRVLVHVQRQIAVLEAQETIKTKVQEELGDRQREILLREQMKAIQSELGEVDDNSGLEELQQRLIGLELPPEARKEVDREFKRLSRLGRESMESQVIRTFLETVAELPWSQRSDEQLDLIQAARMLSEDHYGLEDVKDRVLEFLAVRQLRERKQAAQTRAAEAAAPAEADGQREATPQDGSPNEAATKAADAPEEAAGTAKKTTNGRSPILLFVGPPGVGKTSVARSIARSMGREYVRISLGGARDEADIRGHRRTYVAAMPGRIIQGMKQAGTRNPVFLLDEIDKLGASFQGDPASALLEVLDPAQNDSFTDHYLGLPFDLSEVMFIATANFIQNIPGPLLDRMEVVEFGGYTEREKLNIAKQYLIPRQVEENGLEPSQLQFEDDGISTIITAYTREAGVRQLEREVGRVARKLARKIAIDEDNVYRVDPALVRELLGRPRIHPERAAHEDQVGTATGMYYTPTGGDIMFVEASVMPGKGGLVLTGQLGDVMKESARAAWSYARAHAEGLRIDRKDLAELEVHVHVPAGAIPKDGPSAGVTLATALVSALSQRPARHDVAMTGEITLTGRVLPIGGVKEKILGGVRAGIRHFVLPKDNEADLEDLPQDVRDSIDVLLVAELGEVLATTLRDASFREGRLLFGDDRPEDVVPLTPPSVGSSATH